jgi:UPF0755 protein
MASLLKKLFFLALLGIALAAGWLAYFAHSPLRLASLPQEFALKHGSSLKSVARQLVEGGILSEPWQFIALVRVMGRESEIKAGNYLIDKQVSVLELVQKITRGDVTQSEVVFIEGWTFRQMRQALDANPRVRHDTLGLGDQEILARLGAAEPHPEGLFFPDSYYFSSGMSDLAILGRAYKLMQKQLAAAWQARAPNLPLASPYEALILASIVEKETGKASERAEIAGVFANRLRLGMRLQTDPTVIYGLGQNFDGNLRKRDLLADTAYNTYTRSGLPPTPIAMPGLASLQAATRPAETRALYFVGKGDGSHQFSANLDDHNRAVNRYQRGQR